MPLIVSNRPTSFPRVYPAVKEIAENRTRTPAPTTQVVNVGLTLIISSLCRLYADRFLFVRSRIGDFDFRFDGRFVGELGELDEDRLSLDCSSIWIKVDSGTIRRTLGCT